jgi:hypothetical protein
MKLWPMRAMDLVALLGMPTDFPAGGFSPVYVITLFIVVIFTSIRSKSPPQSKPYGFNLGIFN